MKGLLCTQMRGSINLRNTCVHFIFKRSSERKVRNTEKGDGDFHYNARSALLVNEIEFEQLHLNRLCCEIVFWMHVSNSSNIRGNELECIMSNSGTQWYPSYYLQNFSLLNNDRLYRIIQVYFFSRFWRELFNLMLWQFHNRKLYFTYNSSWNCIVFMHLIRIHRFHSHALIYQKLIFYARTLKWKIILLLHQAANNPS